MVTGNQMHGKFKTFLTVLLACATQPNITAALVLNTQHTNLALCIQSWGDASECCLNHLRSDLRLSYGGEWQPFHTHKVFCFYRNIRT